MNLIEIFSVNIFTYYLNNVIVTGKLNIFGTDFIHFVDNTLVMREQNLRTVVPICFVPVIFFRIMGCGYYYSTLTM